MERLLELLKRMLSDTDSIQKLLAPLVEKLLRDISNVNGCKQSLLTMIQDGTLDDDFKADPIKVLLCLGYVSLDIISFYKGHDHSDDLIGDAPVFAKTEADDNYYIDLGVLMGVNPLSEGPFTNRLYEELLDRLFDLFTRYVSLLSIDQIVELFRRFLAAFADE